LTVLMVTHDLDTLLSIARRIVVLGRGTVIADGTAEEVMAVEDPWIQSYFASRHTVTPATDPGRTAQADGA
jgi:phospholipid/cholesterol/gamma-HCH transport system ATP-binding protein